MYMRLVYKACSISIHTRLDIVRAFPCLISIMVFYS